MDVPPLRLAFVGLMGSGKSKVGRHCAQALGWPFVDADRLLEEAAGRDIPEIFAAEGESGFRRRESDLLAALAEREPPFVLSTGGGVVESGINRTLLRDRFHVVFLDVAAAEACRRVGRRPGRPLLAGADPLAVLTELHARRGPWYAEVARLRLVTQAETRAEDLRDAVLDALETLGL